MSRFDYVKYDEESMKAQGAFKEMAEQMEKAIVDLLPGGRAQSLALTKLEEVYMWIGKAIRDEQIKRGPAPVMEERKDG